MKKITIIMLSTMMVCGVAKANLSWGYGGDLLTFDAAIQAGWLVQMYQDVNSDSVLSSISFDNTGLASGTGASDDALLSSFTGTLLVNAKSGAISWSATFASWSSIYNADVYSVIYNAASVGSASAAVIVDSSAFSLPGADPASYNISSVNNTWQAVPEPATALLFGIGGMGAWMVRRNKLKSKEVDA